MSLNFEAFWSSETAEWDVPRAGSEAADVEPAWHFLPQQEWCRLHNFVRLDPERKGMRRLWFPNGFVGDPGSLRLGLREFGFQPVAVTSAFDRFKAWERVAGPYETSVSLLSGVLGDAPPQSAERGPTDAKPPINWVTEMLCRPVCFAGVGMSDAELGLWWLMVQRARNLAGVAPELRPPAAILVRDDDPRLRFWRTRPCGIEPIICSDWEEGWTEVEGWARYQGRLPADATTTGAAPSA